MTAINEPETGAEPDQATLSRRAAVGTATLSLVNALRLALQLMVLPILARILGPASFGIVALAMPFILFATMLSDGGMGNALIRHRDASRETESTVFWLSVVVGIALTLTICGLAGVLEDALRQPGFAPILMAMSPILIVSGALSVANARIARERRFAIFAAGDLISAVLSAGAAIVVALQGWGAWSLVVQQLVLWTSKAAWILPWSRFRPMLHCRPSQARELLIFGLHNVGAQVADFAGKSAPALVIGSTLGVVAVGHYSMAYQLIRIPDLVLAGPLYLATFTAITALRGDLRQEAAPIALRTVRMVVLIIAPLFCGLGLVSELLVGTLLGPKWEGTAPALTALSGSGFFICLYSVLGAVLMGLGRSDLQFRLSLLVGGGMLAGALIGQRFGLAYAALGVSIGMALALPFYLLTLAKQLDTGGARSLATIARPLIAAGLMGVVVLAVREWTASYEPAIQLAATIGAGLLSFSLALVVISGRQVREDVLAMVASQKRAPQTA